MDAIELSQYLRFKAGGALIGPPEKQIRGLAFMALRKRGRLLTANWFAGGSLWSLLDDQLEEHPSADLLELCLTDSVRIINPDQLDRELGNRTSGRFGIQVTLPDQVWRYSPTEMIAHNRPLRKFIAAILEERGLSPREFYESGGRIELLGMSQFIAFIAEKKAHRTYRANVVVANDLHGKEIVDDTIGAMGRWFMANMSPDGGLPYKYWPSNGKYSDSDNTIRRFMATIAFNRLGLAEQDPQILRAAERNLRFNLARFYKVEDGLGLIEWDGSVKLGAVALAALAILESPNFDHFAEQYGQLRKTIDLLWQDKGSFRTFYRPADRHDNQNFYPGEELLLIASELERDFDGNVHRKALKSVNYYRVWHRQNRNPAFVPWHVMACAKLYRLVPEDHIARYIFEMSDWLLEHQQWGGDLDPDLWGRFYSPGKPYGPPHASSTGVYMEGMIDAMLLARELDDAGRAAAYEQSIWRGLRSIVQLQYKDDVDAFYVSRKTRVMGAVRTETYNNEIRIDNIQHAMMALLRFREIVAADIGKSSGETIPALSA